MDLYIVAVLSTLATLVAVSTSIAVMHMQRALTVYELDQDEIIRRVDLAIVSHADALDILRDRAESTDDELSAAHEYDNSLAKAINAQADMLDGINRELAEARAFATSITKVTEAVVDVLEGKEHALSSVIYDILITIVDLIASNSLEGALRLDGMAITAYDINSDEAVNKIKIKLLNTDLENLKSMSREDLDAQLMRLKDVLDVQFEQEYADEIKREEGGDNA